MIDTVQGKLYLFITYLGDLRPRSGDRAKTDTLISQNATLRDDVVFDVPAGNKTKISIFSPLYEFIWYILTFSFLAKNQSRALCLACLHKFSMSSPFLSITMQWV